MLSFIAPWNTCGRTIAVACPRIRDACIPFSPFVICSLDDGIRHLRHNVGRRHVPTNALTLYTANASSSQCAAIVQALRDHEEARSPTVTGELEDPACFWDDVLIFAPCATEDDARRMVPSHWLCWRVHNEDKEDGHEWYCCARGTRALNPQVGYLCAHTDVPAVVASDATHADDWGNATQRWGAFAHLCVELELILWTHWPDANRPALLSEMISLPQCHVFFDHETIATLRVMCLPEGLNLRNLVLHGFVDEETLPPAWLEWLSNALRNHKLETKGTAGQGRAARVSADGTKKGEDVVKDDARWIFDFDLAPWRQTPPSFFPFGREKIVREAWRFWREGDFYRALLHLLPVLEMGLRRRFARVNDSANHGCAMHRAYYTTLDGHGQRSRHQLLLAPQCGGQENALVHTFSPGQLALLRDLFQQDLGPNIRAQVIHKGVADAASCDACFLAYISFCHEDHATRQIDAYSAQYDPLLLLRDAAQVPSLAVLGAYVSAERHRDRCPDARPAFTDAVSSLVHSLAQHATSGRLRPAARAVHTNAPSDNRTPQSRPDQCQEENKAAHIIVGARRASHMSDFEPCEGHVVVPPVEKGASYRCDFEPCEGHVVLPSVEKGASHRSDFKPCEGLVAVPPVENGVLHRSDFEPCEGLVVVPPVERSDFEPCEGLVVVPPVEKGASHRSHFEPCEELVVVAPVERSDFEPCEGLVVVPPVDVTAFVEAKSPFTVHRQTLMLIEKLCAAFLQRIRHLEELLDNGQARNAQRQQLSNLWVVRPALFDFFTCSVKRLLDDCRDEESEVPLKLCNAIGHFALVEKEGSKTNKGYDRAIAELAALVPRLGISRVRSQ